MQRKNIFIIIGVIALVGVILYSFSSGSDENAYRERIELLRENKDNYMRTAFDSPFADSLEAFEGLHYYPIDSKYRVKASLTPIENKKTIILSTSDGKDKRYLEHAYAEFKLDGVTNKLLILEIMEMGPYRGTLFLAFADQTSGNETYGAGRYLDIKKVPGSSTMVLDFNEAYNPYCAYNDNFSCPFPPKENLMDVEIKAGEKNYYSNEN